ncbi:MAG: NTP transferase domain-containing protein [Candidatus Syntrophopropionicum ammoniitolerans]
MVDVAGVILAGGKSRRMGTDKAFLTVGKEAMIERIAGELGQVFQEILVSGGGGEIGRRLGLKVMPIR